MKRLKLPEQGLYRLCLVHKPVLLGGAEKYASSGRTIIPKGVEHLPVAVEECHVILFEPKTVLNTGNVVNERTVENLDKI